MLTEPSSLGAEAQAAVPLQVGARGYRGSALAAPGRSFRAAAPRAPAPPGIDFALLLGALRRRVPVLVALAVIGAGLGFAVQKQIAPRYTSDVQLLLEPKRSDAFGADTEFGSMYVDGARIASVVSVIESSDLLGRVVDQLHLADVPAFSRAEHSLARRLLGLLTFLHLPADGQSAADRQDRALYNLERAVVVDRVGATYVLVISARAGNPELARQIADAVAQTYLDDQVQLKSAATQRDATWINDRLTTVRNQLQASEDQLDAVRRKYGLLETALGSGATMDRQVLTDLNTQVIQARADVANAGARAQQVQQMRASGANLEGLPEIEGSPVIGDLRAKMADNARQLAALRATYGENYPEIRRLQDAQRQLQVQLAGEVGRMADRRRDDYQVALAREQAVERQLASVVATSGGGSNDEGHEQLRRAQRMVEANQGLYNSLLTRWREVQQQQTREEPEGRIISQASLPDRPSSPKPFLFPVGGAAGLLFLGLGFTLVPPLLERRFTSIGAVEQRLGLPVLGAIPLLQRRQFGLVRRRRNIIDYTNARPLSRFAESLRTLRAYLHIFADGDANIVHVTSAMAGEGKSTVAATLAVSAAAAGVRTVLVDADLRSCSLSRMFDQARAEGLSDVLERGVPLASVLHAHGATPLTILPAGSAATPRPDLIQSGHFAVLLRELAKSHSLVVLDGPPVLPVSDALVMSALADTTILVVQWRATSRDVVERAARMLRTVGAPLAGVILNKIDSSKLDNYDFDYPR